MGMSTPTAFIDHTFDANYSPSDNAIIVFNITMLLADHVGEPWYRELVRRERAGEVSEEEAVGICCFHMGFTREQLLFGSE